MKSLILTIFLGLIMLTACSSNKTAERNPGYPGPTAPYNSPPAKGIEPATFPNGAAGGYPDQQLRTMATTLDSAADKLQKDATQIQPSLSTDAIAKFQTLHKTTTDLVQNSDQGVKQNDEINPQFKEVVKAYYDAKEGSQTIQDPTVREDFDQVTQLMRKMSSYFKYPFDPDKPQEPSSK